MNTLTAVVIEDDPDLSHLIKTVLERGGFTVHTADNGPAGVRAVREHNPSLVTSDMNLPGFDGLEVIRRVRLFSNVPLMIISAGDELGDLEITLTAGADHYLPKPFRPKILQAFAHALLRRPA
ncbi:MAG: response regulator transcription factor [Arthrobacter sp.]